MDSSGSQSWFQSYLQPLGLMGAAGEIDGGAVGPALGKARRSAVQAGGPAGAAGPRPRPAFNDITNNDLLPKLGADKGTNISRAPSARLSQQPPEFALQSGHTSASQLVPGRGGAPSQLPQQIFTDPSHIDSAATQHADKRLGSANWVDVDAMNMDDPQACAPYANAIFQHLRETERERRPNPSYLDKVQGDMNSKMRAILVDWLVEVAEEYRLCADTLYLTVNYIDRFLSKHVVSRSQLQLVGVACMWVAAKYEEIYPPNVNDFCFITDSTYSKEQMVAMEELVLKKLNYELTAPTAKTFLRRLLQVCSPDELLHFLSNYLTELSLLDHVMLGHLPSQIAAAAVYLANRMLRRPPWDGTLEHYSTYSPYDVLPSVRALAVLHQAVATNSQLAAVREKYAHVKFQSVSRIAITSSLLKELNVS